MQQTSTTSPVNISYAEAKHVAKLANLQLTEDRLKILHPQLSSVLGYMSKIQSLDTNGIPETTQVTGLTNVTREDIIDTTRTFTQTECLANAKRHHHGYFVVDAIMEEV